MDKDVLAIIIRAYRKQIISAKKETQEKLPKELGQHSKGGLFGSYLFYPILHPFDVIIDGMASDIEHLRNSATTTKDIEISIKKGDDDEI